jgi:hypothetical protein
VDAVWKLLGKVHVLHATNDPSGGDAVLVLTSCLPKPGTPGDRALRAAGPGTIFDVIELYDPAGLARLRQYAQNPPSSPLPGFWSETELAESPG